jgi:hypothetical protein
MKQSVMFAAVVAAMTLGSCASGKKTAQTDYQYQQWLAQQQQQQQYQYQQPEQQVVQQRQPAQRVLREDEACELLARDANCKNLRQVGMAKGYNENSVMNLAIMNAQERLINLVNATITSVSEKYELTAGTNMDNTNSELFQTITNRYASAVVKNCRVVKSSTYDLSNGQVQIYVCIETGDSKDDVSTGAVNVLSDNGIKRIMAYKDQFKKEVENGLTSRVSSQTIE